MARMPKVRTAKAHCDLLASRIVKNRSGGCCERCGDSTKPLEWAHIIRRTYAVTRCNPLNAWALCRPCHEAVDHNPAELMRQVEATIGLSQYTSLHEAAMAGLQGTGMSAQMWWFTVREDLKRQCLTVGLSAANKRGVA